ncbi:hypothetical protein [Streptomyces canus]|uniref:Uncharacterized protein n=1 Tax=Streptomyces canus TaxID=58343 RepID=A0AAW8FC36_9ACTN|nr:hypothetical protein [Streptomyces canus]MDQ0763872.1 hypothetical protein [Streptomyces canus]MDQ0907639.1 hypothetical protein [Streptomyces canus]
MPPLDAGPLPHAATSDTTARRGLPAARGPTRVRPGGLGRTTGRRPYRTYFDGLVGADGTGLGTEVGSAVAGGRRIRRRRTAVSGAVGVLVAAVLTAGAVAALPGADPGRSSVPPAPVSSPPPTTTGPASPSPVPSEPSAVPTAGGTTGNAPGDAPRTSPLP